MSDERFEGALRAFLAGEVDRAMATAPPVESILGRFEAVAARRLRPAGVVPLRAMWALAVLAMLLGTLLASLAVGWLPIALDAPRNGLIAYVGSDGDVYLAAPDGTDARRLTATDDWEYSVAWSPDGSRLAYYRTPGYRLDDSTGARVWLAGPSEIVVVDPSDGSQSVLASFSEDELASWSVYRLQPLTWSQDGRSLRFGSRLLIKLDEGSVVPQLTPAGVISPDRSRVLVVGNGRVWVTDTRADDPGRWRTHLRSDMIRLLGDNVDTSEFWPWPPVAWSPDSARVAFQTCCYRDGTRTLQTIGADGTDLRTVAEAEIVTSFRWSPDSRRLAFIAASFDSALSIPLGELWVAAMDGTDRRKLADQAASPQWSPDGKLVYFLSGTDAYAVRVDGTGLRQLAADVDSVREDPSLLTISWQPVWD